MNTRCLRTLLSLAGLLALPLVSAAAHPGRAEITASDQKVVVEFYADEVVRVLKWPAAGSPEKKSLVVRQAPSSGLAFERVETATEVTLASPRLRVRVAKADGAVRFETADGTPILAEAGKATFAPLTLPEEKALSIRQGFRLTADEGLYGLGQHEKSTMNYRGKMVKLAQTNTDAVSPVLTSTAGWGIFWDNYSKTVFEDGASGASFWSEVADNVDYYLFAGGKFDTVIAGYRNLTGQAPMYGRWAYGYWQSKEHYRTQAEIVGVAEEYRKRGIPIDVMVQDWNYWGDGSRWSGMVFDPERYPDPEGMIERIHDLNMRLMIVVWPGLGPDTAIHQEMAARGFLYPPVGWAGFKYYDAFNPAANDLYWKHLEKGILSKGADALWIDSTEPDVINALTKESHEYEMKKVGSNHLGSWARYLNAYSLLMMDALYENQRKRFADRRVVMLTRSGFAGQQRSGAITWSGDIGANWPTYKGQIGAGVNFSMSGQPYWTFDIGAFVISAYGGTFSRGGKDPAYQELYTRMFQFGAFAPIFRSHGSETPREIWEFGPFSDTLVKFDRLRYRMLPYIYSLASQVSRDGYTIMRALPADFPADTKTFGVDDQFMFGPSFMVAPVTEYQLHRPPEDTSLVPAKHFETPDGKPGLLARYYKDTKFQELGKEQVDPQIDVFWYEGRPDYVTDQALSIRWEGKLVPDQSGPHQFHIKAFGTRRMFLDGRELGIVSASTEIYTEKVDLVAGKSYDLKVELENTTSGALRALLQWKTPDVLARELASEPRKKTRSVYLPSGSRFVDFWTGETLEGGRTVEADAPIETMPVYVRAGSIVPLGPSLQYATEKPADPIELRVYSGADGSFTLYEDENETYAYEKGVFATIDVRWDDAKRQLVLGERKGSFPGMLKERSFEVVLVGPGHGTGVEPTAEADRLVRYDGARQVLTF